MTPQGAAAIFQVSNLDQALRYYIEVLGFSEDFRFEEYAGIKFGGACLHLCSHHAQDRPVGGGTVCVFCDEVDLYYAELKARGAHLKTEPRDYPYGMRDFMAKDLDGNHLSFGCESKQA
jgi:uncharacterized glyoxalase superfamily protein PhnB